MAALRILAPVYARLCAAAGFWTVLGLYVDLSWHIRNHVDTFFTLPHAILYSGLAFMAAVAVFGRGRPENRFMLVGLLIFAAGGIADLLKHQTFGIEHDFDALASPTHLILGSGVAIALCAPVAASVSQVRTRLADQVPALVSLAAIVELLHWVTNPFFRTNAAKLFEVPLPHQLTADALTLQTLYAYQQGGGLIAIVLQALLIAGPLIYAVRSLRAAPGACTAVCFLGTVLVATAQATTPLEAVCAMAAAFSAGIVGDALLLRYGSEMIRTMRLPSAAFAVLPQLAFNGILLGLTAATQGIWWDTSFSAGALLLGCAFALFLSFIAL